MKGFFLMNSTGKSKDMLKSTSKHLLPQKYFCLKNHKTDESWFSILGNIAMYVFDSDS